MMASLVQRGEIVDFIPARDVAAGEVILFGGLPGVVKLPVKKGELGALALTGVYDFDKTAGGIDAGCRVFWDDGAKCATSAAAGNSFLGIAAANSPAAASKARVILNFGQSGVGSGGSSAADDYEWHTMTQ